MKTHVKKRAGLATLIPEIDFKTKFITTDKEGHYITLKGRVQ